MPRKPIGDQAMTDAERQRRRRERLRKERGAAPEKPAGKAAPASLETGRGAEGNREVAPAPRPVGEVSASLNLTERRFRSFWDQTDKRGRRMWHMSDFLTAAFIAIVALMVLALIVS